MRLFAEFATRIRNAKGGFLLFALFLSLAQDAVRADLLITEPFDYPVGEGARTNGPIHGAAGGQGWATDGGTDDAWDAWIDAGTTGYISVASGSLGFSDFATSGNHLRLGLLSTGLGGTGKTYSRISRDIGVNVLSGTMWLSYLYRRLDDSPQALGSETGNASRWASLRNNTSQWLAMDPKNEGFPGTITNGTGIATRYDAGYGEPDETVSVQDGNVYLMIAKFADLGTAGGGAGSVVWALSPANFDAIKVGGITEAELNANHVLRAVDADPGVTAKTFALNNVIRILIGTEQSQTNAFPFEIALDELRWGTTLDSVLMTSIQAWRLNHFGTTADSGNAADTADPEGDSIENLLEFGLGLDPLKSSVNQLPSCLRVGNDLVMSFSQPPDVAGVTYGAEYSTNLLQWTVVPDSGAGDDHVFSTPMGSNDKLFMRLLITAP